MSDILNSKEYMTPLSVRLPISIRREIDSIAERYHTKPGPYVRYILEHVDLEEFNPNVVKQKVYIGLKKDNIEYLREFYQKTGVSPSSCINKLIDVNFKDLKEKRESERVMSELKEIKDAKRVE